MKIQCSREIREFNRTFREAEHLYGQYAAAHGISGTTLCALYSLYAAEEDRTQTDLCVDWGIPPQTMNSCLKALEKRGALQFVPCAADRKRKFIRLTAEGEALAQQVIAPLIQAENAAFSALAPEEQKAYLALSEKYNTLLRQSLVPLPGEEE